MQAAMLVGPGDTGISVSPGPISMAARMGARTLTGIEGLRQSRVQG